MRYHFKLSYGDVTTCPSHVTMYMGHVVTLHFHSFRVNQEKSIHCINKTNTT